MRNLALWGEAAKALFWRPVRGFVVIFEQRKTWRLGFQEGKLKQSQDVELKEKQHWERRKGRLRGQSQHRAPLMYLHPAPSGAGKGDPQVFSAVQHLRRTLGRGCNLWAHCSQLHRGDKHANKTAERGRGSEPYLPARAHPS